jgi:outer membrane immunogenic protein
MRRVLCFLAATAAISLGGLPARAADLGAPQYNPPPPPPYSWSGFYFGANGGFGGNQFQYPFTIGSIPALGIGATTGTSSLTSSGFFGGGQIGYNWQFAPTWVAGIETDFDGANIQGKATTSANTLSGNVGSTLNWFGTVRGRVGYLVTPTALLYATGGWAYGQTTSSANVTALGLAALASTSKTQNGWTAGAGIEYAFNPWLSLKTEYLYLDLGTNNLVSGSPGGVPFTLSEKTTVQTVKVGLNVKLGAWDSGWGLR